jgi:hypothetical protein
MRRLRPRTRAQRNAPIPQLVNGLELLSKNLVLLQRSEQALRFGGPWKLNMREQTRPDVVLVGAGVMSATLGMLLKQLNPGVTIEILESLDLVAGESSNAWNNAGTGHAALCELNYTPQREDGSVDVSKAVSINESFEVSKQFWSYLVQVGVLQAPEAFIRAVPHLSFRARRRKRRFSHQTSPGVAQTSSLLRDGVFGGPSGAGSMDAAGDGWA